MIVRTSSGDYHQGGEIYFNLNALLGASGSSLLLQSTDIGVAHQPGRNRYEDGVYTLTAKTNSIGGTTDSADFAWKTLPGDGVFIARVASLSSANTGAKTGLMLRETTEPNSRHGSIFVTPGKGLAFQGRDTTGGGSFSANRSGVTAPRWLRIERLGAGKRLRIRRRCGVEPGRLGHLGLRLWPDRPGRRQPPGPRQVIPAG